MIRLAPSRPLALVAACLLATGAAAQTPKPPAPYTPPAAASPAPAPAPTSEATPPAAAPADQQRAVETLATGIEDVQVVGPWTEGERSGIWRTVMMQVAGQEDVYRFFVQQIERAKGAQTILSTTEIKEIASVKGAIVGYRADEPSEADAGGLTLFFDIVPSDGEIAETYELHFAKDAPYVFGPATN